MTRELTRIWSGVGVGNGAAVGRVVTVAPAPQLPATEPEFELEEAYTRVRTAFDSVAALLQVRAAGAPATAAAVLEATALMASDPGLLADVERRLGIGVPPAHAVRDAVEGFCAVLAGGGPYLAERVTDLRDVGDRVVARVLGLPDPGVPTLVGPSVIVARDLAPADTAALDLTKVVAIVTEFGGPTGHTAIIAAQLGIPCVVRVAGASSIPTGSEVAVDAAAGVVHADPDAELQAAIVDRAASRSALVAAVSGPGRTRDGVPIALLANIGAVEDAQHAAAADVEGVGLFRTEVLFLDRATAPTVEEQTAAYTRVFTAFGRRKVVVRTLDAGADKPLGFVAIAPEENPALGVRGLRTARQHPQLLADQLAALAAAAAATEAQVWVMAPMVSTAAEAREFCVQVRATGLQVAGAMVEVPAAALRARHILAEADFISIGTNDLTQYTMAADRTSGDLADLLDPWQPAVLDLVGAAGAAGAAAGKSVGVCGEAARDPLLALVLVGLSVTSLSMAPGSVPAVRFALARTDLATCRTMAEQALAAENPDQARAAVEALVDPEVLRVL